MSLSFTIAGSLMLSFYFDENYMVEEAEVSGGGLSISLFRKESVLLLVIITLVCISFSSRISSFKR